MRALGNLLKRWPRHSLAILLYLGASLSVFRPLPPLSYFFGNTDSLLILYTLEWERFAIFQDPQRLFEGLAYFDMGRSLFFTHLMLGALPVYAPIAAVWGPGTAFAALNILAPVLNGSAMYFAMRALPLRWWPAFVAGLVLAFSPIQIHFSQFLHLAVLWWMPLALMFLLSAFRRPAWWKFAATAFCVYVQFATTIYLGFFAAMAVLVLIVTGIWTRALPLRLSRFVAGGIGGAIVGALPFMPLIWGYVDFAVDNADVRRLDDARQLAARLPHYLPWVVEGQQWYVALRGLNAGQPLLGWAFPGIAPLLLASAGLALSVASRRRLSLAVAGGAIAALGFVLSLGPELRWDTGEDQRTLIALPFALAYHFLPGFASLKNPTFFAPGMMLGIALLCGIAVEHMQRAGGSKRWVGAILPPAAVLLLATEFAHVRVGSVPIPSQPELQAALAAIPGEPAVFLPYGNGPISAHLNMQRVWWSLMSSRARLLNGYSGYEPRGSRYVGELADSVGTQNRTAILDALTAMGIRTLVLDRSLMQEDAITAWERSAHGSASPGRSTSAGRFQVIRIGNRTPAVNKRWKDIEVEITVKAASPGASIWIPVQMTNIQDAVWMPPPGRRARPAFLVWRGPDGQPTRKSAVVFRPPPVVIPAGVSRALEPVLALAPPDPGVYYVELVVDGTVIAATGAEIRDPDEADSARPLAADLKLAAGHLCVWSGEDAVAQVRAINVGSTAWGGGHRLGYTWAADRDVFVPEDLEKLSGRLFIPFGEAGPEWKEVARGSGYVFHGTLLTPRTPGDYILKFGMVEEGVQWFGEASVTVRVLASDGKPTDC